MTKKVVIGMAICISLVAIYFAIQEFGTNTNWDVLNRVISKLDGRGELLDYDNEIGVHSIDDIAFTIKDKKLKIYYGKVELELGKEELLDEDFIKALNRIGITIVKSDDGVLKVKYKGEDVDRWVE